MLDKDFIEKLDQRVQQNRRKWNEYGNIDELKGFKEWALILGEQTGKLQHACFGPEILELQERIFKTAAVLYEIYCLHKKKFEDVW